MQCFIAANSNTTQTLKLERYAGALEAAGIAVLEDVARAGDAQLADLGIPLGEMGGV